MGSQPTFEQSAFRFRYDDGSEITATWMDDENQSVAIYREVANHVSSRLRIRVRETTGSKSWSSKIWRIYRSINDGAFSLMPDTVTYPIFITDTSNYNHGDDSVERLTTGAGGGTYLTDNNAMMEDTNGATNSGTGGQYFDLEFKWMSYGSFSDGDYYTFRVYDYSSAFDSYAVDPVLTVYLPTGTTYYQSVSGVWQPTGAQTREPKIQKTGQFTPSSTLSREVTATWLGSFAPAGDITRQSTRSVAGSLGLAGIINAAKVVFQAVAGALGLSGLLSKRPDKAFTGTITPSGDATRLPIKLVQGALEPSSTFAKQAQVQKVGVLNLTGALSRVKSFFQAVSGTLNLTGTMVKRTAINFIGTLGLIGSAIKETFEGLSGTLGLSGALNNITSFVRLVAGTLGLSGSLGAVKQFLQAVAGVLGLSGTSQPQANKSLKGSLTPAGAATRETSTTRVGALEPMGSVVKQTFKNIVGALGLSGILDALFSGGGTVYYQIASGALQLSGSITKMAEKITAGVLILAGQVSKFVSKSTLGVIEFSGNLIKRIGKILRGIIDFLGSAIGGLFESAPTPICRVIAIEAEDRTVTFSREDRICAIEDLSYSDEGAYIFYDELYYDESFYDQLNTPFERIIAIECKRS